MKLSVDFTRLHEARFVRRAAEIAAQRQQQREQQRRSGARAAATTRAEVADGKRELGVAAGGVRQADER